MGVDIAGGGEPTQVNKPSGTGGGAKLPRLLGRVISIEGGELDNRPVVLVIKVIWLED